MQNNRAASKRSEVVRSMRIAAELSIESNRGAMRSP